MCVEPTHFKKKVFFSHSLNNRRCVYKHQQQQQAAGAIITTTTIKSIWRRWWWCDMLPLMPFLFTYSFMCIFVFVSTHMCTHIMWEKGEGGWVVVWWWEKWKILKSISKKNWEKKGHEGKGRNFFFRGMR